MKPNYTPAPWTTETDGALVMKHQIIATPDHLKPDYAPKSEGIANSRLISAAPELLEAAVYLCAFIESRVKADHNWLTKQAPALQDTYTRAASAIRKATPS